MASAMGNAAGPGYSKRDGTGTSARTSARTIDDADGSEGAEGKIDITLSDKTNKTPILISY